MCVQYSWSHFKIKCFQLKLNISIDQSFNWKVFGFPDFIKKKCWKGKKKENLLLIFRLTLYREIKMKKSDFSFY